MPSYLNSNGYSRGIRNNNPLNLIATNIAWQGKIPLSNNSDWSGSPSNVVKHFEQFEDLEHGIRAGAMDILNDYSNGKDTLRALIYERSPASENNTEAIVNYVTSATGIDADTPFVFTSDILAVLLDKLIEKEILPGEYNIITTGLLEDSIFLLPEQLLAELVGVATEVVTTAKNNGGKLFLVLLGAVLVGSAIKQST